jgi:hypothetical protein
MDILAFWKPWEEEASSFSAVRDLIDRVFKKWSARGRLFAWRGQVDAAWALHSSLYRRILWTSSAQTAPLETHLYEHEDRILKEVHRWGLHMTQWGRLSVLSQLAVLQHYGAPTRLIDITFNPWIGLWFAVQEKTEDAETTFEDRDGRLFAIDVTDRLINEDDACRQWEDCRRRPWPSPPTESTTSPDLTKYREWTTRVHAWRPPHFHPRIAAQNGGFIFGGVPASSGPHGPVQWPKGPAASQGKWLIDEVRQTTSVALRVHRLVSTAGGPSRDAVYTIRIRAEAKSEIRKWLQSLFGYQHATLYPDYTGFAAFGTPKLRSHP